MFKSSSSTKQTNKQTSFGEKTKFIIIEKTSSLANDNDGGDDHSFIHFDD